MVSRRNFESAQRIIHSMYWDFRSFHPADPPGIMDFSLLEDSRLRIACSQFDSLRVVARNRPFCAFLGARGRMGDLIFAETVFIDLSGLCRIEWLPFEVFSTLDCLQHIGAVHRYDLIHEPGPRHRFQILVKVYFSETRQLPPSLWRQECA